MKLLISCCILGSLAVAANGQILSSFGSIGSVGSVGSIGSFGLGSGVPTTGGTGECLKNVDCRTGMTCRMYDWINYPSIWPACPHYGYCICPDNTVQVSNGSCVPYVNLNLGDRCYGQAYEVIRYPEQRCDGSRVICNSPAYVLSNGYCTPAPVPTYAPVPVVPIVRPIVTVTCPVVGWLSQCDSSKACCDGSRGLTCQSRGPGNQYQQCLCANKVYIYDDSIGTCRPRVYGDYCVDSEDCASGLISNVGFECRLGRCRCQTGYDPVDVQFWNDTSLNTRTMRICVVNTAVTWAPTGTACTVNVHQVAGASTTRVCHSNAFCHRCYRERPAQAVTVPVANVVGTQPVVNYAPVIVDPASWQTQGIDKTASAITGICREFTCDGDGSCGFQGSCTHYQNLIDPPCERGTCDCNAGSGFFKDRFSRCSPMRQLWLGDRCIVPAYGLHKWYTNNENWDDDKVCVPDDTHTLGYAGYTYGVVKCKLPLIEDGNGNCVRNDNIDGIWIRVVGYNQPCDEADRRIPITICDVSQGLQCRNKVCQCASTQPCSGGYAGCQANGGTSTVFYDQNQGRCRARGFGDGCQSNSDCCGGTCNNGYCGCPSGTTALDVGSVAIDQSAEDPVAAGTISYTKFCFRNYTVVGKGQECHLDPTTWSCTNLRYGWDPRVYLPPLVCAPGLACVRCPGDYGVDDEAHGTCRSVTPYPQPAGQCAQSDTVQASISGNSVVGGSWSPWGRRNAAGRVEASQLAAGLTLVVVMAALF